ncbi:hypothetical protein [Fodinicurvata sediminis]|uniref:hypothetical protein n=1 Tax=Fodinicurvata sediminis TaxID=1121832 RepID=UPI0003B332B7|nr:hypothetical protein [Fodinicurvata sediminis]
MSDLGGTGRISGGPAAILGAGGAPAQVTNPPPRMLQLAVGHSLKGVVLPSDNPGEIKVRTEQGTLSLRAAQVPPPGSRVTLQIRHVGTELSVLVFADRQGETGTRQAAGNANPAPGGHATSSGPAQTIPSLPAAAPNQHDSLNLGHLVTGQVVALNQGTEASRSLPAAGTALLVRVLRLQPGQSAQDMAHNLPQDFASSARLLTGQVAEQLANGQTLVRSEAGLLRLDELPRLPAGTQLLLALTGQGSPAVTSSQPSITFASWTGLAQLLAGLGPRPRSDTALPTPGSGLAGGLAGFLAALSSPQRTRAWLDNLLRQAADTQKTTPEQRERLGQDLEWLRQLSGRTDSDGWRFYMIPLQHEQRLDFLRLHLRQDKGGKGGGKTGDTPTRFVLDVDFAQLGPLQLDGLLAQGNFELVLRSRQPLPQELRDKLGEVLWAAGAASGLESHLSFQSDGTWAPLPPPAEGPGEGLSA